MTKTTANRYHDICCGHRVHGHENKCAHLHGHNYRVHFEVEAKGTLDSLGRVLDFGVIKTLLCEWLEKTWDHKFLVWEDDPLLPSLVLIDPMGVISVPFNPTAENMALYLLTKVGPTMFQNHGAVLTKVVVEETRKCSASAQLSNEE